VKAVRFELPVFRRSSSDLFVVGPGMAVIDVHSFGFTYPGAGRLAVRDIAFSVESGEIFGFLGPSGAGKSTTQNVLIRVWIAQTGLIRVNRRAW
jgi:fluoroquinolone transport system ATP-binding protein